ncbi:MAG: T9SS type A sorting domain-containing protein [Bacteroidia bacterium]
MHYIKQVALCLLFYFLAGNIYSQNPYGEKTFGTQNNESCFSFIHTRDNGYAMLGSTTSPNAGKLDIYLTKLDSNEHVEWTKMYGGIENESGNCVRQTLDGGFIICGDEQSWGAGLADAYLIRTDSLGNILWNRTYGGSHNDILVKIELTSDSNYIAVGYTATPPNHTGDIFVIKVNDSGDTLWTRIIGDTLYYDAATNLVANNDGGCTISGRVTSYGEGYRDVMLSRLDANGNIIWFHTYGGLYVEEGMAVTHTDDNGYVITGGTETFSSNGYFDVYMMRIDSVGDIVWSKTYGGDKIEATYCIVPADDGGFVVTGFTDSWAYLHLRTGNPLSILGDDSSHVFLMKVNAFGDTVWARAIGGTTQDEAYALINAADGGYIVGAYSSSFSGTDSLDAFIIHTDSLGNSGCHSYPVSPDIGNPATIQNNYNPGFTSGLVITNPPTIQDSVTFLESDPCFGVSVEENKTVHDAVSIFPNPFRTSAVILLPENWKTPVNVTIYDVPGKKIRSENVLLSGNEIKIERKNLPEGIYFIEIRTSEKYIARIKILIAGKYN